MVTDANILEEFIKGGTAAEIVARLVDMANENGGKDNITAIAANISPNFFRLMFLRLRAFKKRQGMLLMWLLISAIMGGIGFLLGRFTA